uniref:Ig-like domain-containing protein n=1 Tax=Poecilia formosa TaxID=48698 RepID=A0A096LTW5_POEFO
LNICSPAFVPVRLTVSPSRSQLIRGESVTLICEDENSSDGWTVKRNTTRGTRTECGKGWGKPAGSSCSISYILEKYTGVYWCESKEGSSSSSSMNLTVGIPTGPCRVLVKLTNLQRGNLRTFACCLINGKHKKPLRQGSPNFFLRGPHSCSFLWSGAGLRFWRKKPRGFSSSFRVKIKYKLKVALPTSKAPPPASDPVQLVFTVTRRLLVFCPYLISTLLFVSFYQHRSQGSNNLKHFDTNTKKRETNLKLFIGANDRYV